MSEANSEAIHSSKLEEQAKAKGDISYSYWAATDKPANSDVVPKKLSEGEAAEMQQSSDQAGSQHTASAWNSAGTFEERCVTEWAKQQLEQTLPGTSTTTTSSSSSARIIKCTSITGDANIWFIRGKKRHGFEFNLTLAWQLSSSSSSSDGDGDDSSGTTTTGTIKLPSASPDELDDLHMEVNLDKPSGDAAADSAALQAAKGLKQPLEKALTQFYAELKAK